MVVQKSTFSPASSIDVVIIGAGPAGLAAGAALRKVGTDFIILEKSLDVGSSWRGHYDRLHLHTIKQLSALPYYPFPARYPLYVPRALMIEYLDSYAKIFDLKPRFGETVSSVRRASSGWQVESTSSSIRARHVVVATGLNGEPTIPHLAGIETFPGQILHSAHYADAAPFVGKSVLVVGMGNTGAEIALALSDAASSTTISVRDGVHIAPRDLFGIPIQLVAMAAIKLLPVRMNDVLFPFVLDIALGHPQRYGLRRPKEGLLQRIASKGRVPVLDVGTVRKIADGAIKVVPAVSEVRESRVVFVDGTVEPFDAIILATGFRPNYGDFLPADAMHAPFGSKRERKKSTMHFVGFNNSATGLLREIAREALGVAARIRSSGTA